MAEKKVVKRKGLKNVRKAKKRHVRNLTEMKKLKNLLKAARNAVATKAKDVKEAVLKAVSVLDKAAERGIIHLNRASRLKSRLQKALNKNK
jgi:small subunit ribosomal protein S20